MEGDDGCAMTWMYLMPLNYILKVVKMVNFVFMCILPQFIQHILTHAHIHIYIYMCVCVYIYVCVCVSHSEAVRDKDCGEGGRPASLAEMKSPGMRKGHQSLEIHWPIVRWSEHVGNFYKERCESCQTSPNIWLIKVCQEATKDNSGQASFQRCQLVANIQHTSVAHLLPYFIRSKTI